MPTAPKKTKPAAVDDFNGSVLADNAAKISTVADEIEVITERLATVEAKIGTPEKFAKVLEEHMRDSKKIDAIFATLICELIRKDDAVRDEVRKVFAEAERSAVSQFWRRCGGWIVGGGIFGGSAIVSTLINRFLGGK